MLKKQKMNNSFFSIHFKFKVKMPEFAIMNFDQQARYHEMISKLERLKLENRMQVYIIFGLLFVVHLETVHILHLSRIFY